MNKAIHRRYKQTFVVFVTLVVCLFGTASNAGAFGKGAKGPDVYAVQGMLKSLGYFTGMITGYYGSETEAGVKRFQQRYGLPVTGAVDDKTLESILYAYANAKIIKRPPSPKQPSPSPSPSPKPPESGVRAEEGQMIEHVNTARKAAGLQPLAADSKLSEVARLKSKDMIDHDYFSHQSPTYGSPFEMMQKFHITYSTAGENIACNQSVEAAHEALMNSPGHRENLMNASFTRIGIGIVDGGPCGKMFTQLFIGK
ncbi:peptidoglycan-binding protein [Paenibacillus oceani]|uniref:peptidoglycan-binding protein n=1 Tax=Paenibacillus oceani TaxID=2772510 RepID=UPI00295AB4A6|nr:peptidoglycan-binding protein [Paenibacillus oceani]